MRQAAFDAAYHSIKKEAETVARLLEYLDKAEFEKAVGLLASAPRIMTSGCGNSGVAAKKFAHCLCCIEKSGAFMPTGEAVHGGMGFLKVGDVLLAHLARRENSRADTHDGDCQKKGVAIMTLTENADSPLARGADALLLLRDIEESDPTGLMATSSFMAPVALLDALLSALIVETSFTGGKFGLIHPGGAVGERLNNKQGQ